MKIFSKVCRNSVFIKSVLLLIALRAPLTQAASDSIKSFRFQCSIQNISPTLGRFDGTGVLQVINDNLASGQFSGSLIHPGALKNPGRELNDSQKVQWNLSGQQHVYLPGELTVGEVRSFQLTLTESRGIPSSLQILVTEQGQIPSQILFQGERFTSFCQELK